MRRLLAILSFAALPLLSCAPWEGPASSLDVGPVVTPGPAPALAGDWIFSMPRGGSLCTGTMTIDGATGQGTYVACFGVAGRVQGAVADNQAVTLWLYPDGLEPYWMTGRVMDTDWFGGSLHGAGWHDEVFDAHRAP